MSKSDDSPAKRRQRQRERERRDQALFNHLGAAHRLEAEEIALLEALGEQHRFTRRCDIFVRPALIDATPDPERWTEHQVERLRQRLGGEPNSHAPGISEAQR